ncbi:glycosyltransferase [Wenzhouxiangella limi]|uniref:Glycosyltransferase family 4 protein n=1 Tax=Wenzhouxiangella limi TaxID=2707351 RepID=A0A845V8M3_9GAMM|nr:glycosyltransferase [Wenzhouxiangella limi]NDY96285.1 glycosyltransferase family 4 protein [Wenzhouxiangella limi]
MRVGLVGWGIASGVGSMNYDIVRLAPWVTHWLVPKHPNSENHEPYLQACGDSEVIKCELAGSEAEYKYFLDSIDVLLYVEHPCLRGSYNIVLEAKKRGVFVIGVPMWEWWPESKDWALATDMLWAVTDFTYRYLSSLSDVLFAHGFHHCWRNKVVQGQWGVNLDEFPFVPRKFAKRFVFINGNGGYKLRKASDVIFDAFSLPGAPPLTVYTQQTERLAENVPRSANLILGNFDERKDVYADGDVFIFCSYWEGLGLGLYEAQCSGALVVTTDHAPMNECGTDFVVPVEKFAQENLAGKKIVKAVPSASDLFEIVHSLNGVNISEISEMNGLIFRNRYDLRKILGMMYEQVVHYAT